MEPKGVVAASMPHWISVEERLPDDFISVIVYIPGQDPFPVVREGYRTPKGFVVPSLHRHKDVTHWMPMPQPPKEDKPELIGWCLE